MVATHSVVMVMVTLSCSSFSLLSHLPHTHLLAMGLNVAKCNLGEVKRDDASQWSPLLIICGVGLGPFQDPSFILRMLSLLALVSKPCLVLALPSCWVLVSI